MVGAARSIRHPSKGEYDHINVPACGAELSVVELHHAVRVDEEVVGILETRCAKRRIDIYGAPQVGG